jgi:hypothetical protein
MASSRPFCPRRHPPAHGFDLPAYFLVAQRLCSGLCDRHDVAGRGKEPAIPPEHLAQRPFDSIPANGGCDLSRHRDPQPVEAAFRPPEHDEHEVRSVDLSAEGLNTLEIGALFEPILWPKGLTYRGRLGCIHGGAE